MSSSVRVHFIGIDGSGMLPLARLAALSDDPEFRISGTDRGAKPEALAAMDERGWRVFAEHDPAHVAEADIVVYSSAIAPDHPERARAAELARTGALVLEHRMDFLMRLVARCPVQLAVAGTHGKTSTASLLGWVLQELGFDPDIIVGGRPAYLPESVRRGAGRVAVYETDESDASFLRATAGFRLILNIDRDHLEHYGDMQGLVQAFADFAGGAETVVLNEADTILRDTVFAAASNARRVWFRTGETNEFPAGGDEAFVGRFQAGTDRLEIVRPSQTDGQASPHPPAIHLPLPGRHFASNALGALALIRSAVASGRLPEFAHVDEARIVEAMNRFPGVERRLQLLGRPHGVSVYDDYGHHPTEIRAVLAALRGRIEAGGRVVAVFQPHRYSRTAALYAEFAEALAADADRVFLLPIYSAGEAERTGVNSALIRAAAGQATSDIEFALLDSDDWDTVFRVCSPGDVVACLGAGNISASIRAYLDVS